jgi:thiol-disulfide isomerase/thioredoxin
MTAAGAGLLVALLLTLGLGTSRLAGANHEPILPASAAPVGPDAVAGLEVKALFEALAIKRPEPRVMAPDVPFTDTKGQTRRLAEFRGTLVLVNFWATWCPPCLAEMPELDRLYAAYREKGFVVVAISTDVQGPEYVRQYVAEKGFSFPVFLDPSGLRAGIPFRLLGIPASYLVGPDGEFLGSVAGPRSWAGPEAMALVGRLTDTVWAPAAKRR